VEFPNHAIFADVELHTSTAHKGLSEYDDVAMKANEGSAVRAGRHRPVVDHDIQEISRVVMEKEHFVGMLLFDVARDCRRDVRWDRHCILCTHGMSHLFNHGGAAVLEAEADDQVFNLGFAREFVTAHQEGVSVQL